MNKRSSNISCDSDAANSVSLGVLYSGLVGANGRDGSVEAQVSTAESRQCLSGEEAVDVASAVPVTMDDGLKDKAEYAGSSGVSNKDSFKAGADRDKAYESLTGADSASNTGLISEEAKASTSNAVDATPAAPVDATPAAPVDAMPNREIVYSRKVFVGGLPVDIDAERIEACFRQYGVVCAGWPHMKELARPCPPRGFCFLRFQDEEAVHRLVNACLADVTGYYTSVSSPSVPHKLVQIRPWVLADAETIINAELVDPRKAIFIGGVPRPVTSSMLAELMSRLFGDVAYAAIDTDPELGYPMGSARIVFINRSSKITAISARFVQIDLLGIHKRVEIKPFVLDDQICDVCLGNACDDQQAPYYCDNVACLLYLCNDCWAKVHAIPGREFHKPLVQKSNFCNTQRARAHQQSWTQEIPVRFH